MLWKHLKCVYNLGLVAQLSLYFWNNSLQNLNATVNEYLLSNKEHRHCIPDDAQKLAFALCPSQLSISTIPCI